MDFDKKNILVIAASDSGGGAGIERDIRVISDLGGHACVAITALTAQNSTKVAKVLETDADFLKLTLENLIQDIKPQAIKIGLVPSLKSLEVIRDFLKSLGDARPFTVYDPVATASVGFSMSSLTALDILSSGFLDYVDLLTPNLPELSQLSSSNVQALDYSEVVSQAEVLMSNFRGNLLVTGGHNNLEGTIFDVLFKKDEKPIIFKSQYFENDTKHGTGCAVSSAIATLVAQDLFLEDACTAAIMYVSKAIYTGYKPGLGSGTLSSGFDYDDPNFIPKVCLDFDQRDSQNLDHLDHGFNACEKDLGLYPVVPSTDWVESLLKVGVKTIQLRIKDKNRSDLESEIKKASDLGRQYEARVFIDDHWELAIKYNAYGVHLGQEDILTADLTAIAKSNLRLGLSTHGYFEIAKAMQLKPSYIALGHIFPTKTKVMKSHPQGLIMLEHYVRLLKNFPTVAIGGIKEDTIEKVKATGVDSIAVVTAITEAENPEQAAQKLMGLMK